MTRIVRLLSIMLLVVCAGVVSAQTNIAIRGEVTGGAGKKVLLFRYSDMLTRTEVLVDSTTVGENRHFELNAYANYPTMMMLQIENYSQSFFVEPGRDYEVFVGDFDWNIDEQRNVFLDPVTLPLEFLNMPDDDLNALISNFEWALADYIDAHRLQFDARFRPQKKYFDSLVVAVSQKAPDTRNEFFNRYKRYQLASLKYDMHFDSRANMVAQYVKDQPILYYDDNYMSFFATLFAQSVSKGTKKIPAWQLGYWVNTLNVNVFLDSLGTDSLLRNEQVRELVALQALQEAYYQSHYYESDKVVKMIALIGAQSKFPEHKVLAEHLVASLHETEQGSEAKSFVLPDVEKNLVNLDSLKGKWIYLSFVRVGDPNSIGEVETMAHFKDSLYKRFDNLEFVTICCDRSFQKMYHFLKNSRKGKNYNWTWLHFDGNYDLLERYQVVSYPYFVLINPEGQLQYTVTPSPATGFLLHGPWDNKKHEEQERPALFGY